MRPYRGSNLYRSPSRFTVSSVITKIHSAVYFSYEGGNTSRTDGKKRTVRWPCSPTNAGSGSVIPWTNCQEYNVLLTATIKFLFSLIIEIDRFAWVFCAVVTEWSWEFTLDEWVVSYTTMRSPIIKSIARVCKHFKHGFVRWILFLRL